MFRVRDGKALTLYGVKKGMTSNSYCREVNCRLIFNLFYQSNEFIRGFMLGLNLRFMDDLIFDLYDEVYFKESKHIMLAYQDEYILIFDTFKIKTTNIEEFLNGFHSVRDMYSNEFRKEIIHVFAIYDTKCEYQIRKVKIRYVKFNEEFTEINTQIMTSNFKTVNVEPALIPFKPGPDF